MAKVYMASSWRNPVYPGFLDFLRKEGHEVWDWRNPPDGNRPFRWSDIDPNYLNWTAADYRQALKHPRAQSGFISDFSGMKWAQVGVLLLPSGRSAHLEIGWMSALKPTCVLTCDGQEPELMALMTQRICLSIQEVSEWIHGVMSVPTTSQFPKTYYEPLEP